MVDGGSAFKERIGVGGNYGLVDECYEEAKDEEVELEVFDESVVVGRGRGEGMVGFGRVFTGGFEVVAGGGDEVV